MLLVAVNRLRSESHQLIQCKLSSACKVINLRLIKRTANERSLWRRPLPWQWTDCCIIKWSSTDYTICLLSDNPVSKRNHRTMTLRDVTWVRCLSCTFCGIHFKVGLNMPLAVSSSSCRQKHKHSVKSNLSLQNSAAERAVNLRH